MSAAQKVMEETQGRPINDTQNQQKTELRPAEYPAHVVHLANWRRRVRACLVVGDNNNIAAGIEKASGEGADEIVRLHSRNAQHGQPHQLEDPLQDRARIMELLRRCGPLTLV